MAKHEILMAGTGGQGLVFVASFLAEAGILAGQNTVQTQTYGISQRGGFISAEVLLDEGEILFQQVITPSIILALSDVIGTRYDDHTMNIVYDNSLMKPREKSNWIGIPCTKIAKEVGVPRAANLVGLGAMIVLSPIIPLEFLCKQAERKMKKEIADLNIEAIKRGMKAAEAALGR